MSEQRIEEFKEAIKTDSRKTIASLLARYSGVTEALDAPLFKWGQPALAAVRSVETAELLLRHGACVEKVGEWWKPGFGVIPGVDSTVGRFLVDRGAVLSPHAAAALGLTDRLAVMLGDDPECVHAPGGDGATPLHFARTVEMAGLLIDHGAELDARDDDHDSTPAQWLIGERPQVAAYLLERGARPDIFLAAALGDRALAQRLISEEPRCLALRVGKAPMHGIGYKGLGGTILQWSLGFNSYAHQYAVAKGHQKLFDYLYSESDVTTRFLVSSAMGHRSQAEAILAENPDIVASLEELDLELPARYCWETNTSYEAVELMLDLGFPIDTPERSHGYSPLHNAAWGGYADLVDLLIKRGHRVDEKDPAFQSTPLGWALHCCLYEGRHPEGEYGRVAASLIDAGCLWDATVFPTGDRGVDSVLEPRLRQRIDGAALLGDHQAVKKLLDGPPDSDDLALALLGAAKGGHVSLCELLLEAGAPIRVVGVNRSTPLHKAVEGQSQETAELLLSRGAPVGLKTGSGSTALHIGCFVGADQPMIEMLLAHGARAEINAVNDFGSTALDLAISSGHPYLAKLLREKGGLSDSPSPG